MAIALALISGTLFIIITKSFQNHEEATEYEDEDIALEEVPRRFHYGLDLNEFDTLTYAVKSGDNLGSILLKQGLEPLVVHQLFEKTRAVFDPKNLNIGQQLTFFRSKQADSSVQFFVLEVSALKNITFATGDSLYAMSTEKQFSIVERTAAAAIQNSLYVDLTAQGVPVGVVVSLADLYAWSIDFFKVQKNDSIRLIYEEKVLDDTLTYGSGRILAASFYHKGKYHYGFYFKPEGEKSGGYYDEEGNALKAMFLKAPLNFFRISSRYNLRRFHPVLKTNKPHLGTDYAAPTGTPIMSTANGVVEAMGYTSGNGNYVKIKHNSTYSTQYLHMSKFASGLKKGKSVSQGEVIGYVGSTGLATGPHVCYRFWKNGKQIDPLSMTMPNTEPIDPKHKEAYLKEMNRLRKTLDKIAIEKLEEKNDPS